MCSNCLAHLSGVLWSEPGQRAGHLEMAFMWVGFVYSPGSQDWLVLGTHFSLNPETLLRDPVTECREFCAGGDKELGDQWLAGEALLP